MFDFKLNTKRGVIFYICFKQVERSMETNITDIKVDSRKAHNLIGHCNRKATREAAVTLGWIISGVS